MSDTTQPAPRQRKLTTGHHTLDWWAADTPLLLALCAVETARHFDPFSPLGAFLWVLCAGLAGLAVVIPALRVHVTNHKDYYGGLALIGLALLAFWAGSDLAQMRGFSFGAGTAPRLFAAGLAITAVIITVTGLVTDGEPIGTYAVRGPFFVCLGVTAFALLIRGVVFDWNGTTFKFPAFGLVIASLATFLISAFASKETRWVESIITSIGLTAFCWFLFVWMLGLPFQIWPTFLLAR
jgi:putative tricarboxylic transport membrane protein